MASINLFDRSLKILARNHAELFLRLALPDTPIELLGRLENVELSLPVQPVDFVHRVVHAGQEHLLHIEFQLEHFADFPRRMCNAHGTLTQQYKLPVLSFALYLKYRQAPIPNEYVVKLGERTVNRFTYPVLKLWDYVEQISNGQYRELAPLLVMLVEQPDETVLETERSLILAEPDEEKRGDLLALALSIAARSFDKEFLRRFFREEVKQMEQTTLLEEIFEEWAQERLREAQAKAMAEGMAAGKTEGKAEGEAEGMRIQSRTTILRTLQFRFSLTEPQAAAITKDLAQIQDLAVLNQLIDHALSDFSLAEFLVRLDQLSKPSPLSA